MSRSFDALQFDPPILEQVSLNVNPQTTSPLFALIPDEIRNDIFIQSLAPYDVLKVPTPFHSYGYRPEHAFAPRCAVELLRTCKRIYIETRLIVPETMTFTQFECSPDRAPKRQDRGPRYYDMTAEQQEKIRTVQIYAQQYTLERNGWISQIAGPERIQPRRLTITLRHHDWWNWEEDNALELDTRPSGKYGSRWQREIRRFSRLEEFAMELETLERRKSEMDELVKKVQGWKIPLGNGRALCSDGIPLTTWTWAGSLLGQGPVPPPPGSTFIPYYVVRIEWRVKEGVEGIDDLDDDICEYLHTKS